MFTHDPILCPFNCHQRQVEEISKVAKERVDLAKALIRASEKPAKPPKSAKGDAVDATKSGAGAESAEAAAA